MHDSRPISVLLNEEERFVRTTSALEADNFRAAVIALLTSGLILAGWTGWMISARVSVQTELLSPATLALRAAGVRNP